MGQPVAPTTAPSAAECGVLEAVRPSPRELRLQLLCSYGIRAVFVARLRDEDCHYLRVQARIWVPSKAGAAQAETPEFFGGLRLYRLTAAARVQETMRAASDLGTFGLEPADGLPIVVDDRFFLGVEHPMGLNGPSEGRNATHWRGAAGMVAHLDQLPVPSEAAPWLYGAVFGAISEPSQARRAFIQYLHAERPGRRTPMVHYNSWYDFYSYQDEGFNGGFKDPHSNPALIAQLRPDRLSEDSCLRRVTAFGKELVEARNTTIDSFLWDDGWDDPQSLWQFDQERFPRGFDAVAAKAVKFGAGTGVWLSPWGGYGFPQEARVKYGKEHGWETNFNHNMEVEAFSLAGPHYRKAFRDVALKFVREQGVNMFKFDGVAGDPKELAVEMEAMLQLIHDLRAATSRREPALPSRGTGAANESREAAAPGGRPEPDQRSDDDIWINLTTGTWASPFFLLWADSIWRGGPDIASRPRDWAPDRGLRSDGLSRRQRWIRWRNVIVFVLVVMRSTFFPLSQLMIHGVIVGSHGDALHWGLDTFDAVDFAQEVWSFVALGLQLQELYVAPRHMTPQAWDILAEGLQWARREAPVLRDSHWAFGDPTSREVYCVASWDVAARRGFVMLHNPTGLRQASAHFSFGNVLELPAKNSRMSLWVAIVKSIARLPPDSGKVAIPRLAGVWNCTELPVLAPGAGQALPRNCSIGAAQDAQLWLHPSEVLVLAVSA